MMIGIFLILFGSLMLLDKLGWIDIHLGEYLLPILLIALGVSMVVKRQNGGSRSHHPRG